MRISSLNIYNFSNNSSVQNHYLSHKKHLHTNCINFNGKNIQQTLKNIDFSKLNEHSLGVLNVINTGTFAQILKFKLNDKLYAVKRLYPYQINQPQADLCNTERPSLQQQLQNEISVYKKLKDINGIPKLYSFNSGDEKNLQNNYIVTSWAEGHVSTKDGAIYETELVKPHLPQIYNTLAEFDKKGISHGDLWAGNILFSKKEVNIIDFNDSTDFNPEKEYKISNLDDFKTRFLNIFLADIYHRKGIAEFLKTYKECLILEQNLFKNKKENIININAKNYFNERINNIEVLLKSPYKLKNQAIKTIYDSNVYWAEMMKIRKNQGDFRYYLERASKLKSENPEILGGTK